MRIIFVCLLLAGCASSTTLPLSKDTVQITARAAPICGGAGAERVALTNAAVETIRRGYDRFMIIGGGADSDVRVAGHTPVTAHTNANVYSTGYGTASANATTTYSGGQPIIAGRHRQGLIVKMFKDGDPNGSNAVSARETLGPDWQKFVASESHTCFD